MRSKLFLGTTAGFSGALVIAAIIFALKPFGIEVRIIAAISELFITGSLVGSPLSTVVGLLAHLVCGSLVGIAFFFALEATGFNHWTLKGAFMGAAVWFVLCGVMAKLLDLGIPSNPMDTLWNLVVHIIYGIVTAWVIVHFYSKSDLKN